MQTNYAEKRGSKTYFENNEMQLILEEEIKKYKNAYDLMCDTTWDLIPDEEKWELHKKLNVIFDRNQWKPKNKESRIDSINRDYLEATKRMNERNSKIAKEKNRKKN